MYLASEAVQFLLKDKASDLNQQETASLRAYKDALDSATKFIPTWVKIAVALSLGLRNHDWLEADRCHRRCEDRQEPPDLRSGCIC
jgi:hypothetical protein